jgi:Flp pilus assembly protein CpaB
MVMPLFQNVQVIAVGQETNATPRITSAARYNKADAKDVSSLVTVVLSPQEANIVSFVQEQSKIRLVLRSPADSKQEPVHPINWDTVFQYLMPQPETVIEEPKPIPTVEIYRGLQKERIPLSD